MGSARQKGAMRIVLASASPRRRELLTAAALEVEVRPAAVDEAPRPSEAPEQTVTRLAREKAAACAVAAGAIVVAADTEVVLDGGVLGKPADVPSARAMLARMAGRPHDVITGFCVRRVSASGQVAERVGLVRTRVVFRALTAEEIAAYVATGEPFDKAGGYGIQGRGGALVDHIEGSYPNVVGLPVAEVLAAIREIAATRNGSESGS